MEKECSTTKEKSCQNVDEKVCKQVILIFIMLYSKIKKTRNFQVFEEKCKNVTSKKCEIVMENVCSTSNEEECSTEMRMVNESKGITKNNNNITNNNEMK